MPSPELSPSLPVTDDSGAQPTRNIQKFFADHKIVPYFFLDAQVSIETEKYSARLLFVTVTVTKGRDF